MTILDVILVILLVMLAMVANLGHQAGTSATGNDYPSHAPPGMLMRSTILAPWQTSLQDRLAAGTFAQVKATELETIPGVLPLMTAVRH